MITIELYGVPRLRAGLPRVQVEGTTVAEALRALGKECPALEGTIVRNGKIAPTYRLSLNGQSFITDTTAALGESDVLLLLSADAGG
jgi:molybdopterin converting factor small subunit